jgi:hypothetical protein
MKCSSEKGNGLAICTSGSGKLKNCTFRCCGIRGCPIAGIETNVCGALVIANGATSESKSGNGDFEWNVD